MRSNPKISTMPRQQSESSQYLTMYQLTIEKKRLQQELASLDQRRDRIQNRLAVLAQEIETVESQAQQLRKTDESADMMLSEPNCVVYSPDQPSDRQDSFHSVTLDY
ncbi:MAG: hypothetical protein AAFR26_18295 [Cyanobacteria bacterium J06626_4]